MTNTTFSKQLDIVAEFYLNYAEAYSELVETYDLGFPLAVAYWQGGVASLTDSGKAWISEAYDAIINEFDIDPEGIYDSLGEIFRTANDQR